MGRHNTNIADFSRLNYLGSKTIKSLLIEYQEYKILPIPPDLNTVLSVNESLGSTPPLLPMREFSDMVDFCGFTDVPFTGSLYTWCRSSETRPLFRRLDRILVNLPWKNLFHSTSVEHLNRTGSDHSPLLLCIQLMSPNIIKSFQFQVVKGRF